MAPQVQNAPTIDRSITLDLVGDWGQATFHKILGWLSQEFCDRAGPRSRTRTWTVCGGGVEAIPLVHNGEADLCVVTPNQLMAGAISGQGIFAQYGSMPHLRALAVLPQRDRMILAVHPKLGVQSFEDIRQTAPALEIATSKDDGTSFIGYVATQLLAAHGITTETLRKSGGKFVEFTRPHECLAAAIDGRANAVIQEAIMLPEWNELVEKHGWIPIQVETAAIKSLLVPGFSGDSLPEHFWSTRPDEIHAIDFSDFLLVVRDDMPSDVAELLTWCLVHTRANLERQFKHIPPEKCALTYPLDPVAMSKTSLELHPGARKVYQDIGVLRG
ncbi:hypothetical protein LTR84_010055 [Exophiala bonariae]|uniref:SsuA/THI5-like domain-containing protein n=1 Tax=Exophiala bonariae TaxID=1690606 RepID=A0AAV9NKF3_9EURO|nr:hypothetical protein LTR84_010055 [Exophiala bonariae]